MTHALGRSSPEHSAAGEGRRRATHGATEQTFRPGEWEQVLAEGLSPLREARGWSQADLAARSGLHRRTILRIERRDHQRQVSLPTIEALARAFGYIHRGDLWLALQSETATSSRTPLMVGERVRVMMEAFMDLTPQQQRLIEGVILIWSAREQARALGAEALLDLEGDAAGLEQLLASASRVRTE